VLLVAALVVGVSGSAQAGSPTAAGLGLLAPGVGWTHTAKGLFWTEDNGKHWNNVTPRRGAGELVSDALAWSEPFFLDTRRGWLLLAGCSADKSGMLELGISLLSTADSGATWTCVGGPRFTVTDYGNSDAREVTGCGRDFAFADSLRGWVNVTVWGATRDHRWAFLLTTSDGGRTWQRAVNAPSLPSGKMVLATPSDGWLKGWPSDTRLFATQDGAKSWQEVKIERPKGFLRETWVANCLLPTFRDAQHGFLPVSYSGGLGDSTMVLFKTNDGGRTWTPNRRVTGEVGQYGTDVIANDAWIFVALVDNRPKIKTINSGENVELSWTGPIAALCCVSFATPSQGWIDFGPGLMSTTDGGKMWTDITPR
jgi:hypothetical protein